MFLVKDPLFAVRKLLHAAIGKPARRTDGDHAGKRRIRRDLEEHFAPRPQSDRPETGHFGPRRKKLRRIARHARPFVPARLLCRRLRTVEMAPSPHEVGIVHGRRGHGMRVRSVFPAVIDAQNPVPAGGEPPHKPLVKRTSRLEQDHHGGELLLALRQIVLCIDPDPFVTDLSPEKTHRTDHDALLFAFGERLLLQRKRVVEILP